MISASQRTQGNKGRKGISLCSFIILACKSLILYIDLENKHLVKLGAYYECFPSLLFQKAAIILLKFLNFINVYSLFNLPPAE